MKLPLVHTQLLLIHGLCTLPLIPPTEINYTEFLNRLCACELNIFEASVALFIRKTFLHVHVLNIQFMDDKLLSTSTMTKLCICKITVFKCFSQIANNVVSKSILKVMSSLELKVTLVWFIADACLILAQSKFAHESSYYFAGVLFFSQHLHFHVILKKLTDGFTKISRQNYC